MDDYNCGKLKVGDKGQRYVVYCHDVAAEIITLGYTDREDGEPFKSMVGQHPSFNKPYILDREDKYARKNL